MAFFFSDNPIAMFLGLILVIALLSIYLKQHKWFSGKNVKHSIYVVPILLILAIFLIGYSGILRIISFSVPLIVLLLIFLFFIGAVMFALGIPRKEVTPILKSMGFVKVGVVILVFCIIALGASRLMGESLLEDKSVSLGDVMMTKEEPVDVDFSWLFSKTALGIIFLFLIIGIIFVWVNISS
ncbi:hypothetical protein KY362_05045 [Candidatus Woesearchaeota archaeon]|nr:hypothetical protein [Candidatus Woesearchaeota archaeon]